MLAKYIAQFPVTISLAGNMILHQVEVEIRFSSIQFWVCQKIGNPKIQ